MKTQIVYKVLSRHNKKLFSYAGIPSEKDNYRFTIRYFVNKTITPRENQNPFIFCFDTFNHAKRFLAYYGAPYHTYFTIYEAEATDVKTVVTPRNGPPMYASTFRDGTVFASSLKLIRRIK